MIDGKMSSISISTVVANINISKELSVLSKLQLKLGTHSNEIRSKKVEKKNTKAVVTNMSYELMRGR